MRWGARPLLDNSTQWVTDACVEVVIGAVMRCYLSRLLCDGRKVSNLRCESSDLMFKIGDLGHRLGGLSCGDRACGMCSSSHSQTGAMTLLSTGAHSFRVVFSYCTTP